MILRNIFLFLFIPTLAFASAPDRPSGSIAVSGVVISSQAYNNDFNTVYTYLQNGVSVYEDGSIVNADIATNAAFSYSKLNLSNSILNADINSSAAIADTKLAQITTAGKVSGAAITSISSVPSGAGLLPTANLGSGTATGSTFLRGDQTWATLNSATSQIFVSSGTFTAPAGIIKVYLTMVGGGGGGAGAGGVGAGNSGAGGGAGAVLVNYPFTVVPGNSYTVTIGAGGSAGGSSPPGDGGNGGDTSFDTVTVAGGGGGNKGTGVGGTGLGGARGGGSIGLAGSGTSGGNRFGALSGAGADADVSAGSGGGATIFGNGGDAGNPTGSSATANTGAGGGGATNSASGGAGGAGGSGICIVSY